MKTTSIVAATAALLLLSTHLSQAQDAPRYDKSIEAASAKRAAQKVGDLRGLIEANSDGLIVTPDDLLPKESKKEELSYPSAYRKSWEKQPDQPAMPPMVENYQLGQDGIDTFITTTSVSKFDSRGNPVPHHQDQRHFTPLEVGRYMLEAIKLNPFPKDR